MILLASPPPTPKPKMVELGAFCDFASGLGRTPTPHGAWARRRGQASATAPRSHHSHGSAGTCQGGAAAPAAGGQARQAHAAPLRGDHQRVPRPPGDGGPCHAPRCIQPAGLPPGTWQGFATRRPSTAAPATPSPKLASCATGLVPHGKGARADHSARCDVCLPSPAQVTDAGLEHIAMLGRYAQSTRHRLCHVSFPLPESARVCANLACWQCPHSPGPRLPIADHGGRLKPAAASCARCVVAFQTSSARWHSPSAGASPTRGCGTSRGCGCSPRSGSRPSPTSRTTLGSSSPPSRGSPRAPWSGARASRRRAGRVWTSSWHSGQRDGL